ncbi:MAG: ADP-ribose pyrophosphatase, partial [bacterium]
AFSTEKIDIFAAYDLKKSTAKPDDDEFIKRKIMNYEEAVARVKEKKITDSKTIIALLMARCAKEFR